MGKRKRKLFSIPILQTPEQHQLRVALRTLRMPAAMRGVMGQSLEEGMRVIERLTRKKFRGQ